jgi:predicted Zn finger-like uncharacterized protein
LDFDDRNAHMSLITRCPACTTMFRVVADQLRLSDGWVRCGQCDEVFDANAHVQSEFVQTLPDESADVSVDVIPDGLPARSPQDLSQVLQFPEPPRPAPPEPEPLWPVITEPVYEEPQLDLIRTVDDADADVQIMPAAQPWSDTPPPSFVRTRPAPSVWHRPAVRGSLGFLSCLLGFLFIFQFALQERDQIAARQPQARPLLIAACDWLQCQVRALRHIESLAIDSSSFVKVKADVYRVNFTLKNTGTLAVATPAMELTLTDTQDRPVVRRVFLAGDFDADRPSLDAGTELAATLSIGAKVPGDWARVSGYRLLAFYP